MIQKAQQGRSAHMQGTEQGASNLWPLAQPRWKDFVRYSTEGDDGTNQESCKATDTIDTNLSTTFRNRGTAGWDALHRKREGLYPAPQEAGSDLTGRPELPATREMGHGQLALLKSDSWQHLVFLARLG